MTNSEALRRAKKALEKAIEDTNSFDNGDMTSPDIYNTIVDALKAEFAATLTNCCRVLPSKIAV